MADHNDSAKVRAARTAAIDELESARAKLGKLARQQLWPDGGSIDATGALVSLQVAEVINQAIEALKSGRPLPVIMSAVDVGGAGQG